MSVIYVSFPVNQETWNKAVIEASREGDENMVVRTVGDEAFIVEYENLKAWDAATNRFNGAVEFTRLDKNVF